MFVIADRCSYDKAITASGVCVLGTAVCNKLTKCSYCIAYGAVLLKCAHLWSTYEEHCISLPVWTMCGDKESPVLNL